jgi:hypothetical protein
MNYQHIMNLAVKRRATLVKRLDKARESGNEIKCDQLCYSISIENDNIYFCKQKLEQAQRELAILLCKHNREVA